MADRVESDDLAVGSSEMGHGAHEFIADRDTALRLADSYVLYVNTRPRAVVFSAAFAVGVAAIAIGAALSEAWINSVLVVITGGAGGAVGAWIAITVQRNRLARQLRGVAGEGHRLRLEARDDALLLEMRLSSGRIEYAAFDSAVLTGDAVLLKTRNGASYTVLPKQLFPAATLADVRQRIADASTS